STASPRHLPSFPTRRSSDLPLMEVNCSSFHENLLENELFGHEKGAFTDASDTKKGLVELCDRGTLFLDEVADMPLATQSKLLRLDRKSTRLNSSHDQISYAV